MAVLINETFDAGIPSGLFTPRYEGVPASVTYNADQQAVDFSQANQAASYLIITALPLMPRGTVTVDIELLSNGSAGYEHCGLAVMDDAGNHYRFDHQNNAPGELWFTRFGDVNYRFTTLFTTPAPPTLHNGERRLLRVGWDWQREGLSNAFEGFVDGAQKGFTAENRLPQGRPAIFVFQASVRVHSILVDDTVSLTMVNARGLFALQGRLLPTVPPPVNASMRGIGRVRRSPYFKTPGIGTFRVLGKIAGTTKSLGTPTNAAYPALVAVYEQRTKALMGKVRSDAKTGVYEFRDLDLEQRYVVVAFDDAFNYRAVIADNVQPEAQ